jgi:hypothetical protein
VWAVARQKREQINPFTNRRHDSDRWWEIIPDITETIAAGILTIQDGPDRGFLYQRG